MINYISLLYYCKYILIKLMISIMYFYIIQRVMDIVILKNKLLLLFLLKYNGSQNIIFKQLDCH